MIIIPLDFLQRVLDKSCCFAINPTHSRHTSSHHFNQRWLPAASRLSIFVYALLHIHFFQRQMCVFTSLIYCCISMLFVGFSLSRAYDLSMIQFVERGSDCDSEYNAQIFAKKRFIFLHGITVFLRHQPRRIFPYCLTALEYT